MDNQENKPKPPSWRRWSKPLLQVLIMAGIVGLIWYLPGNSLLRGKDAGEYASLDSKGIKLGASSGAKANLDEAAPDFALQDVDGKVVRLSDYRGQVVVLNFWATWCTPCRREFPEFAQTYDRERGRGLAILGVNVKENLSSVRRFTSDFGATFPILMDAEGDVASQYRIAGLPVTWFIDAEGILRAQVIGLVTKELLRVNLEEAGFKLD